ncbi:MAG: hypothetical protein M3Y72_02665 [Acidobacteriota bacterium]|nr:hypothetical protein [Acidobacteriota bacterium]
MGYKTIEAKRKEYQAKVEVCKTFVDASKQINDSLASLEKSMKQMRQMRDDLQKKVSGLDTAGVKEFEDFKKDLLSSCKSETVKPLPTGAIEKALDTAKKEIDDLVDAWVDKLAGSFPKELKPGMTLKDCKLKRLYEVTGGPEKSNNENLKGDAAIWFKVKIIADGKQTDTSMSLAQLSPKNGIKYIKT